MPGETQLDVLNAMGCPFDMDATAALVAGAELVITVDTMIAHLAGALGKPTWLLLKAEPDWRWAPDRRTTPWYPSMRLYVQPSPGDWESVIAEVERDLSARGARAERQA
jgi:ADP-heptose:LPS heptosyltransferase